MVKKVTKKVVKKMNEEEKQAIEKLDYELTYSWVHNQGISKETLKLFKDIIEKQQKEIEKLEDRNQTLEIEFEIKKYCKVNELASDLIFYKNLAGNYQGNCISKDKVKEICQLLAM